MILQVAAHNVLAAGQGVARGDFGSLAIGFLFDPFVGISGSSIIQVFIVLTGSALALLLYWAFRRESQRRPAGGRIPGVRTNRAPQYRGFDRRYR